MADSLTAGGAGKDGTLNLLNAANEPMLETTVATTNPSVKRTELKLGAKGAPGTLRIKNSAGQPVVTANGSNGSLNVGGAGGNGSLTISASDNDGSVQISTGKDGPEVFLGAANKPARIQLTTGGNPGPTIDIDGSKNALLFQRAGTNTDNIVEINGRGKATFGGFGHHGNLILRSSNGSQSVELNAASATARVGGDGANGQVSVRGADGQPLAELLAFANEGVLGLGQPNRPGRISVYGSTGEAVRIEAGSASVRAGGSGTNGTVSVRGKDGTPLVELLGRDNESVIGVGQPSRPGRISLFGAQGEAIRIDAATGDILLLNADIAEECDLATDDVEPGMVVVLTEDGSLTPCQAPYDHKVAGVISGAGTYAPALVLDRRPTGRSRAPIALMGKVYCWTDADAHPVAAGDLLTTAERPGHAMRVVDRGRALGAMLGKALAPLESGQGLVPVLVGLR